MSVIKRLILMLVVLFLCVGCDQTTKLAAESYFSVHGAASFMGDTIRLQLAHNPGAFLSLGANLPTAVRDGFFTLGIGGLLLALLGYALLSKSASPAVILACALLFAGGVSNLADRLMYAGTVIDFINIGFGSLRTGIFNIADVAITLGELMLVVNMLRERPKNDAPQVGF